MIPLQFKCPATTRSSYKYTDYISMVTRRCPRKHIPRASHACRPKRLAIRNNPIYCVGGFIFYRIFLSLLSLKPSPHSRTGRMLTSYRHSPLKPARSSSSQHLSPISLRSLNHLGPSQPDGRQPCPYTPSPIYYDCPRTIFHATPGIRILRSTLHNLGRCLWVYLLCSYRIPRTTCYYWLHFPNSVLSTTIEIPLHI